MKAVLLTLIAILIAGTTAIVNAGNIAVAYEDSYNVEKPINISSPEPMNIKIGDPNNHGAMKGNIKKFHYEKTKRFSTLNTKKVNLHGFTQKVKKGGTNFRKAKHYRRHANKH